jgi:hypothetical protein
MTLNLQLKKENKDLHRVLDKMIQPAARSELIRMNSVSLSPIDNIELELLHSQAQSNYELMVSYKKDSYSLSNEK